MGWCWAKVRRVGEGQIEEGLPLNGPPNMYLCESEFRSEKSFPKK